VFSDAEFFPLESEKVKSLLNVAPVPGLVVECFLVGKDGHSPYGFLHVVEECAVLDVLDERVLGGGPLLFEGSLVGVCMAHGVLREHILFTDLLALAFVGEVLGIVSQRRVAADGLVENSADVIGHWVEPCKFEVDQNEPGVIGRVHQYVVLLWVVVTEDDGALPVHE
jgi:hypothetical protein